ncbi:MAG TPA: hypothetical protein VI755_06125 [Anaerolineales bacterium]|nr:hypothetical protein [Anaerolineales bacterium]
MSRPSKRFTPSKWSEYLVPVVLIFLVLALVAAMILILASLFGLTPGT